MTKYTTAYEVDAEELDEIFNKLHEAQKEIRECYERLQALGVLKFTKKEADNGTESN